MAGTHNPLLPEMATVIETVQETHNIKTFRVRFDDEEKMKNFTFQPGQVGQLSVFGVGESTFVINSSPTRMDYLQFSVMKAGETTARPPQAQCRRQDRRARPARQLVPLRAVEGQERLLHRRRHRHGPHPHHHGVPAGQPQGLRRHQPAIRQPRPLRTCPSSPTCPSGWSARI